MNKVPIFILIITVKDNKNIQYIPTKYILYNS